jgi:hypothetical protein
MSNPMLYRTSAAVNTSGGSFFAHADRPAPKTGAGLVDLEDS